MSEKLKDSKHMLIYWLVTIAIYVLNIVTVSFHPVAMLGVAFCGAALLGLMTKTTCFIGRAGYNNLYKESITIGRVLDSIVLLIGIITIIVDIRS